MRRGQQLFPRGRAALLCDENAMADVTFIYIYIIIFRVQNTVEIHLLVDGWKGSFLCSADLSSSFFPAFALLIE